MPGVPIRINSVIYQAAKQTAKAQCRSIPNQIEYWATLGKCALENPDLPIDLIQELLIAKHQDPEHMEPFNFE